MSYLEPPRLHFAGRFQADATTVNNYDPYHNNDLFEPRFQWLQNIPDENGGFNPLGSGAFRLRGCRVTSVAHPDGRYSTSPDEDPIIGAYLSEDNLRVSAKIVDIHPHAQNVPEIFGLRLRLQNAEGAEFLKADFDVAAVADVWRRDQSDAPIPDLSGVYQSVLSGVRWSTTLPSPFMGALRNAAPEGLLSVKFTVNGTQIDPADPNVMYGRIVGSIGVYRAGEPRQFVAARRLRQVEDGAGFNDAPCLLDEESRTVFIDLGNSVPTTTSGGPLIPLGPLRLAALVDETPHILAPLEGLEGDYYPSRSGIATVRLTPEQVATALTNRLVVVDASDPPTQLLSENEDATYARADTFVFRIFPGTSLDRVTSTFHATRFGRPAAGIQLWLGSGDTASPLEHPGTVTTGADGHAEFSVSSKGPNMTRPYIDGQVVKIYYGLAERPGSGEEGFAVARVFDRFEVPENPNWVSDIQPIFQRYANLFPAMQKVLDLGNYNHVLKHRDILRTALTLPLTSPNHMPVTRDLSPGKRDMIMRWLDSAPRPLVLNIDTPQALRAVLQQALLLEQAVIPPYLAALFSIKANRNVEVADIISGVVREEMLHLALVGNLLNAVGGEPQIGRPGLVPTYPGRLPAPVLPDLNVRLRRCSVEQIRDVFLTIETPQKPVVNGRPFAGAVIDRKSVSVDRRGKVLRTQETEMTKLADFFNRAEHEPMTIGWFYTQIARAIWRLHRELAGRGEKLFTGDPARQVSWPTAPGTLYQVTDVRSALLAIYEIIEQGEGSPQDLDDDPDPERLGHYYRFQQIVQGRRLIRDGSGKWVYKGAPIRLDPDGVHPMQDDPDAYRLAAGSAARRESELSNEMYTNLLTSLNLVFNGHPEGLSDAMGLMFSLRVQAKKLLEMPTSPGAKTVVGPAFQSPGVVLE
jgi:hypothetical protein